MKNRPLRAIVLVAIIQLIVCGGATALSRADNLVPNGGFEDDHGWAVLGDKSGFAFDDAVAHSGKRSLKLTGASLEDTHGAMLSIPLDPPVEHPFIVSGWSKAENAEADDDYDIYLDLHYSDDTPLWGQKATFSAGTHDWEYSEFIFNVAKPVKSIEVYVLFRKAKGTVWFDDIAVKLAPFAIKDVRVIPGLFGDGLGVAATTTLPASWHVALGTSTGVAAEQSADSMPVRFLTNAFLPMDYEVDIAATDKLLNETIHYRQTIHHIPAQASRGYATWVESSMKRIMPTALPPEPAAPPKAEERAAPAYGPIRPFIRPPLIRPPRALEYADAKAELALAGNEHESFQVAILPAPGFTLKHVSIETSDLVCATSNARISRENIEWRQVGYVKLDKILPHPADPGATGGWWPDALLPVEKFDVQPGFTQSVWVTVYAPPETPAGHYAGTLTIKPENSAVPLTVAVRAHVYGFSLPARSHLKTAFALMDGFLERVYGKPLTPALRQAYGDFLLNHRLNPDDISRTSPPAIEDLLHYGDRLNAFNALNMVEERGDNPWVCFSPEAVYTPEFKNRLKERLDPYVAQLRQKGLIDRAYIYTFDERGKEFYPILREFFGMVKEKYPEIHTLTTAYVPQDPAVMKDLNIDWVCPLTPAYKFADAEKVRTAGRAAGREVWAYICMGPRYPYANWLCDHPLIEARVIWWQAYQQKMDGFLYWGLNIWDRPHNDKQIDPANGPLLDWSITTGGEYDWLHGDGRLLYAGKDGPIGSIRLENIRDGLEDYEYLARLADVTGDAETARAACAPVAESLTKFTRNPDELAKQRDAIAVQIEKSSLEGIPPGE